MHDPQTLAFEIKSPLRGVKSKTYPKGYRKTIVQIWHVDPETDGSDDSCGWFMRSRHGSEDVLNRIIKRFEADWDRVWTDKKEDGGDGSMYFCGLFCPNGEPHYSVHGVVLNLFFSAACEHFNQDGRNNWERPRRWMQQNLFDILLFAENPVDSLTDTITRKFSRKIESPREREDRIRNIACVIYGWILRQTRPWYKHPKWHFWHWKIRVPFVTDFKRWAFSRCCKCGKRFAFGYSPITDNWNSKGPRWFKGETDVYHSNCSDPDNDKPQQA